MLLCDFMCIFSRPMCEPLFSFDREKSIEESFMPLSKGSESATAGVSIELVKAHMYHGQEMVAAEFIKIAPPKEMIWMSSLNDVPIASDKFDNRSKDISFYRRNSELIQIVKIRNCTLIFFIKDSIIEGSVILTKRGEREIEIEYAKSTRVKKDGIAKDMILMVLANYYVFGIEGKMNELYGEVVPLRGKFNFGSYITLIRAGFVPIRRSGGDGIRFVFPTIDLDKTLIINNIMTVYDNYQKSSEEYLKESQSIAVGILGGDLVASVADKEEVMLRKKNLLEQKVAMAKLFEEACLQCASSK